MSDLQQYVGSCLCGAVTYQIDGPIGDIIQCHCQKCRKANGTAYATNAPIVCCEHAALYSVMDSIVVIVLTVVMGTVTALSFKSTLKADSTSVRGTKI